jgi:tRNA pseudouridine38-40 synthase
VPAIRFAATVSYDGTDFAGSQRQPGRRTVQEELERAAQALFGQPTRVSLAGRTDSGVHAISQVAAFSALTALQAQTVGRALNSHLPDDIAVRDVRQVPGDFDPRRWARRRWYRYTVCTAAERQPLLRRTAWHAGPGLDPSLMGRAAQALAGTKDFAACSGAIEVGRTTVRTVFSAGWRPSGCLLLFDIEADAFLPHMVRLLAGAMVRVGRGSLKLEEFVRLLEVAEPGSIGPAAPPLGLCLQQVSYDEGYRP